MRCLVLPILLIIAPNLEATDLIGVYQDALQHSPLLQNYLTTYQSTAEGTPIALGSLLPQIAVTGNATETHVNQPGFNSSYPSLGYGISLTQPLFNYSNYANLAGASDNKSSAAATYQSNLQNFILTVGSDYFSIILAEQNVAYAEAQVNSLGETLKQTKQQFEVGLEPYTNVLQAKANYTSAIATLISDQNTLQDANQTLSTLTGKVETNLAMPQNNFPFSPPSPNDINAWVQTALQNNQALIAQHYTTKAALANVNETVGTQLPSVNLVLNYNNTFYRENVPAVVSTSTNFSDFTISLQLNWNVFAGGEQMASSLQAANQYASSQNTELNLYRQTVMQTKQDFLSVMSYISQVKANESAVIAAKSSLKNYNAEYKVGTATIVDVLNANQTLYQYQSSLATAVNGYLDSLLQLEYDAGSIDKDNLLSLNEYLQVTH